MNASSASGGWDVYTHIMPAAVITAGAGGLYGMLTDARTSRIYAHGIPPHPLPDTGALLDLIANNGLDGAIVSVPPPLFRPALAASARASSTELANDGLLTACHAQHSRLHPFPYLPIEDPELAAKTVSQLSTQSAGAIAGTELGTLCYAPERFDPLQQALSDAKLALFIHPGSSPDRRLDAFYLSNLLGNDWKRALRCQSHFSGLMHRFPELKVILAHRGGCIAALSGHRQRGATTQRSGLPPLAMGPCRAVRRFYVDSVVQPPRFCRRSSTSSVMTGFCSAATGRSPWGRRRTITISVRSTSHFDGKFGKPAPTPSSGRGCIHKFPNGSTHTART